MAIQNLFNLPPHLIVNGLLHELEAVQVLDLSPCAQRLAGAAHRHIGVAAKTSLLHVAVTNANPGDDFVQSLGVSNRFQARAHVGLGHDLEQGRARAVQIDAGLVDKVLVQGLARVLFQMRTHETDRFFRLAQEKLHLTAHHHGDLKLADLVAFGQIGVEIIFSRKNAALRNLATHGQAKLNGALNCCAVHHWQGAGEGQIHSAGLGVGFGAKSGGGARENFALGGELGVGLKANHHLKAVDQGRGVWGSRTHAALPGRCVCHSLTPW